jgi:hypothetical protein
MRVGFKWVSILQKKNTVKIIKTTATNGKSGITRLRRTENRISPPPPPVTLSLVDYIYGERWLLVTKYLHSL